VRGEPTTVPITLNRGSSRYNCINFSDIVINALHMLACSVLYIGAHDLAMIRHNSRVLKKTYDMISGFRFMVFNTIFNNVSLIS